MRESDETSLSEHLYQRIPLLLVFLSGIGFSIQSLVIKMLAVDGFHGTFQCVFSRGFIQFFISSFVVYFDSDRLAGKGPKLFGNTNYVRWIMFLRSVIGFGGVAFAFLSVEILPIGDSTVLVMLSPLCASIGGYLILGEPYRAPEIIATIVSLTGAVLVVRPTMLFGNENDTNYSSERTYGIVFAFLSAISAGIAYVLVRMLGTTAKMPWSNVCMAQAIGQMVLAIPSVYIAKQKITFDLSATEWGLIFTGGFVGAWSQVAMTVGMQREKSASATAMRVSDVLFGFIWQYMFTQDKINLLSFAGALLVAMSIIIIVAFKQIDSHQRESTMSLFSLSKASAAQRYSRLNMDDITMEDEEENVLEEVSFENSSPIHKNNIYKLPLPHNGERNKGIELTATKPSSTSSTNPF